MKHEMKLQNTPFLKIKKGKKTIEMRLYDEKRQKIKLHDIIEFTDMETNEKMCVEVIKINLFNDFGELYKNLDKTLLGYDKNEIASPNDMNIYYSKEEQEKYGVVGIEIKLIKNT